MKCAAGIVLYNPDIARLRNNLEAIIPQVDKIFLVDNGSENQPAIRELLDDFPAAALLSNNANEGIAKALNQLLLAAEKDGDDWLLTLDQDSVAQPGLVAAYTAFIDSRTVEHPALLTCQIKDRNYGINPRNTFTGDYQPVKKCITSACFTNVKAAREVGGFDEAMFIDYVDFELCFKLSEAGYDIIRLAYVGLLHELGQKAQRHSFLGISTIATNHSPQRVYYFARNMIYTLRKHPRVNRWGELKSLVFKTATIILYEKRKFAKIKAICRGLRDGLKM